MGRPRRALVNVVPTPRTREVAKHMVDTALLMTGPDAVVQHLTKVEPEQVPALLGLLLNQVKVHRKPGRPRMPDQLSEADMRAGYSQYRQGVKNDFTRTAYRQYQRTTQRARRDAGADPRRVRRQPVAPTEREAV